MVIYADLLFVLNAVADYLLLLVSARAAGAPLRRGRFVLGAMIGGIYAVCMFLPGFSFLSRGGYPVLFGGVMVVAAFGMTRLLLKQTLIFLAVTFALGGGVMAIGMMDGAALSLGKTVIYSMPDLKLVMLSAAGCFAILNLVAPVLCRHTKTEGELQDVTFELLGKRMTLIGFSDSGNTLTDTATGRKVPVVEGVALSAIFPEGYVPTQEDLLDPPSGMERLNRDRLEGRFRLLPYRAVGVERGFLLGVRMDGVTVRNGREEGMVVALSPTPVSDGGGYHVLIGGD